MVQWCPRHGVEPATSPLQKERSAFGATGAYLEDRGRVELPTWALREPRSTRLSYRSRYQVRVLSRLVVVRDIVTVLYTKILATPRRIELLFSHRQCVLLPLEDGAVYLCLFSLLWVLSRWQLAQTTSHLAISARIFLTLPTLAALPIPNSFLLPSRWSKSMT